MPMPMPMPILMLTSTLMPMLMLMLIRAQMLAAEEAKKRALRAEKRAAKRKKARATKCKTAARLTFWFKFVTRFLCLSYCSVMALITVVYGIKFTLRGEELARQQDVEEWGNINITYFEDEITNASMMRFDLNESIALELAFVTEK
jgi:hypothetical protein